MRLYLTRHGKTEWNVARRMQGWKDSPLTQEGIDNAKALARRLKDIKFAEIYSSSVGRAMNTAKIVTGFREDQIIAHDDLREISLGSWEGQNIEEIESKHSEQFNSFWKAPHIYKRADTENFYDVQKRALAVVNDIIDRHKHTDNNILIVTHTITLKSIMAYFEGREMERLWDLPYIYDTSLSILEIDKDGHKIMLHGDISHLDQAVWEY